MTKTKTKTMTITELSRITGVSGASITALVKKWKLKPTKTGEYNRKYYSAKDCQYIIDYYQSKAKTTTKLNTKDEIIKTLKGQVEQQQHQLDIKDEQIAQLQEQLKMAQINLNLNQAQQSLKGTLELANKKQKKLEESVDGFFENAKKPKKHWWNW